MEAETPLKEKATPRVRRRVLGVACKAAGVETQAALPITECTGDLMQGSEAHLGEPVNPHNPLGFSGLFSYSNL